MATVNVPGGLVALSLPEGGPVIDPILSNRASEYHFDLIDRTGAPKGALAGVTGGSVSWNSDSPIQGGGRLTVDHVSDVDWLNVRIAPSLHIEGAEPIPLGIFIPSAPRESRFAGGGSWDVELLDRNAALDQAKVTASFALDEGANVVEEVTALIEGVGEAAGSITPGVETLANPMVWEAGTTVLVIINDLLTAAGYDQIWSDMNGQFRVEKSARPTMVPPLWEMFDNEDSLYLPDFTVDRDIFSVPNQLVLIGIGGAYGGPPSAVVTNEDPNSPFSFQNRGRWITQVESGVEATSQEELDRKAVAKLVQLTQVQATLDISHAPVPNWAVGNVIQFANMDAGIYDRFQITQFTIDFSSTALARSTLIEVNEPAVTFNDGPKGVM